jgi:hypothetical protein
MALRTALTPKPKNVVNTLLFAPFHRFDPAVMAVAAHQDADLGPVTADAPDHVLEDGAHLHAGGRLALAQDHRHRLAAGSFIDVDRQEAALVVVRVEQRQLLMAMHRIERVVDVERDRGRYAPVALAELVHHGRHQPGDLELRRRILQPRHRRLRAQGIAALRQTAHRHLEDRIVPQRIAIVGVLVARSDRQHPKPEHLGKRVLDALGLAPLPDARSEPIGQAKLPLHAAKQKNARVRRKLTAIEAHAQFLAANRWKIEGKWNIFAHDGCGAPQSIDESVSQPES